MNVYIVVQEDFETLPIYLQEEQAYKNENAIIFKMNIPHNLLKQSLPLIKDEFKKLTGEDLNLFMPKIKGVIII